MTRLLKNILFCFNYFFLINNIYSSEQVQSLPTLIQKITVYTGTGMLLTDQDVILENGLIKSIESHQENRDKSLFVIINGDKKFLTPGIIDLHSHLGVIPNPGMEAHYDGNESIDPNTANVWAQHAIWPQDAGFATALKGGVTSMQILPGSANLFGGRSIVLKNKLKGSYQEMVFPNSKQGLKMACGENPKRVYGSKGRPPITRMGNVAGYRAAFAEAKDYLQSWKNYEMEREKNPSTKMPKRDLKLDTLAGVLKGEILVQNHCYRADEMLNMVDLSKEFGYKISAFHHAVEFYKVAPTMAKLGICGAMWADWWGFKMEAYDGVLQNAAISHSFENSCVVIHSDDDIGIQHLYQEASKAYYAGLMMKIPLKKEDAISWITLNPARALELDSVVGSVTAGKMADIVIWDKDPFSIYAKAQKVFIDGQIYYDEEKPELMESKKSDFLIGR